MITPGPLVKYAPPPARHCAALNQPATCRLRHPFAEPLVWLSLGSNLHAEVWLCDQHAKEIKAEVNS